jgi:hypothetical protein
MMRLIRRDQCHQFFQNLDAQPAAAAIYRPWCVQYGGSDGADLLHNWRERRLAQAVEPRLKLAQ